MYGLYLDSRKNSDGISRMVAVTECMVMKIWNKQNMLSIQLPVWLEQLADFTMREILVSEKTGKVMCILED